MMKEFFTEANGHLSSMRLMSFISLIQAIAYCNITLFTDKSMQFEILVIWIVGAFAPKVIQKYAEK